jgi:hypothetical protein
VDVLMLLAEGASNKTIARRVAVRYASTAEASPIRPLS